MRRILSLAALAALVTSLATAPVLLAAAPTIERIVVSETFDDEFLSDLCGVPVTTTATGTIISRTFMGKGVQAVSTVNLALVASSGENSIRFRDVGADVLQSANGTLIVLIIGQVPFDFRGVLKIDPATGDVVLEPHWIDADRACAVLAA
jgi:hypothetical protein